MKRAIAILLSAAFSLALAACAAREPAATPIPLRTENPPSTPAPAGESGASLRVWLINTGESDALLIQTDEGALMVDTGLKGRFDAVEETLSRAGVTALEGAIITHGHKDHIGGLKKLLKLCTVARIYTAAVDDETYSKKERETIDGADAERIALLQGDSFALAGLSFTVLAPDRKYVEELGEDDNNNSLVLFATFGETRLLLMGDATDEVEAMLLRGDADLRADVLKAGRHGKDDASSLPFIAAVSPKAALLTGSHSEGDTSPSAAVVAAFEAAGAAVYSNDTELLALELTLDDAGNILSVTEHAW